MLPAGVLAELAQADVAHAEEKQAAKEAKRLKKAARQEKKERKRLIQQKKVKHSFKLALLENDAANAAAASAPAAADSAALAFAKRKMYGDRLKRTDKPQVGNKGRAGPVRKQFFA